jgi:hypothetical protein
LGATGLEKPTTTLPKKKKGKSGKNRRKNKKKQAELFAAAIDRNDAENKKAVQCCRSVESFDGSAAVGGRKGKEDTKGSHDDDAPEEMNYLKLTSEQRMEALQNVRKQAEEKEDLMKKQQNPSPCGDTLIGDDKLLSKGKGASAATQPATKENEEVQTSEVGHRSVKSNLLEAINDLSGDAAFLPMKDMLVDVLEALSGGKSVHDSMCHDEEDFNVQHQGTTTTCEEEEEEEEESFFEPPPKLNSSNKALTVVDALEYVIRSCMVKVAIKVAQALNELLKPHGNLESLITTVNKKMK